MSSNWLKALALVCVFAAAMLAVEAIVSWIISARGGSKALNLRLKMIGRGMSRGETLSKLRRDVSSISTSLPAPFVAPAQGFERMLTMAGLTIPTTQLMLILLLAPFAVLIFLVLILSGISAGMTIGRIVMLLVIAGMIGWAIPLLFIQAKANRRRKKMQDQFPVALDVFVRGLRAGHPVAAALELLTVEMPDPMGSEFGMVVDEVTYGADLRDALESMAQRWDLEDIRMFVVCLSVQSETGGNLAEILENLSKVIRDRASMMLKVRALSSEGRMTAIMLTALPILAFTLLFLFSPSFYLDVADDPAFVPGFAILIILYLIGFFTIRRMVDLKV